MTSVSDGGHGRKKPQSETVNTNTRPRPGRPAIGHVAADITSGNPLQLLINDAMVRLGPGGGKSLSLAQVVARSGRKGGKPRVSKPTVSNVVNGKVVSLKPDTIAGLARALDLDPAAIEAAVEQTQSVQMTLPKKWNRLSPEAWKQLLDLGDYLLDRDSKKR